MRAVLFAPVVLAAVGLQADPVVRFAAEVPFSDGARVESVWSAADTLVRFTTVGRHDVAIDPSEVQGLFDEKNLYLSAKGWYDGKTITLTDELRRENLFEFFVQDDAAGSRYVQVRVREDGTFDCHEFDQGVKRKCVGKVGVVASVTELPIEKTGPRGGLCAWRANVSIPFALIGSSAPGDDRVARIGVMRHNRSLEESRTEISSLTTVGDNFGLPAQWQSVTLTRRSGKACVLNGDVRDCRVNYFANGEFDVPSRGWQTFAKGGQVDRVETVALSGEWAYRTTGSTYRFLSGRPVSFEPNTDYTLMVKARRYGEEGALGILTMKQLADGRSAEGAYLGGTISLGADFHEYYFPFKTDADIPTSINFYRRGPAAADKGVEIAAVKLFKGRVSALEIRPVSRIGLKRIVAGTEMPMRPNPYGRRRESLKALVFVHTLQDIREYQEVFAGLNVSLDVLHTTAVDQDIYETDSKIADVLHRLEKREYGLFIVGERAAERIGDEMAKHVLTSVRGGAGLLVCPNRRMLHFAKALDEAKLGPMPPDHTLRQAFPYGCYRPQRSGEVWTPEAIRTGCLVKGRLMAYPGVRLRPRMNPLDYGATDVALTDYFDAWLARVLYWTAGIDGSADGKRVLLSSDRNLGKKIDSYKIVDTEGCTLDYAADIQERKGPQIFVSPVVDSVKGEEPFVFDVVTTNAEGLVSSWKLEDISGRILESGRGVGRIEVPTRALYTNLGVFRVELSDGETTVDAARANAYARDRDRSRTYDDFTASIWPMGDNVHPDTIRAADQRLLEIGFRASLLPVGKTYENTLAGGLALGGGFLGGGENFFARPQKDNVRDGGSVTSDKGRKNLAVRAREEATRTLKYGVTQCVVCDEPNFTLRDSPLEPCEHPDNVAAYRREMERRYGTVADFNRRHGTQYGAFAELRPVHLADARATGRFAEFIDWRNFNVDRWCEAIKIVSDNGRSVDPDLRLSLYNSFGQTALSGNDYWKLLTKAGLEFSNEYTAMVYFGRKPIYNFDEFYRSFRPDLRVWGFTGYQLSKEQIAFMPWWFAAHRYGGFTWFATWSWRWNVLDIPTCALNGDAVELKRSLDDSCLLKGLGKYTLVWNWVPRDVALYYSHESLMVSTLLGTETKSFEIAKEGPLHEYMYSRQGLQYLVESLLYQHDFVAPDQVEGKVKVEGQGQERNEFLDSYKIVFMPRILALSDKEIAALKRFVARGGTVVADVMPGDYDELGVKRAKNPFKPGEIEVWGRSFDDLDMKQHAEMLSVLKASGARPVLASPGIETIEGREAMRLTDGIGDLYMILRMTARSADAATQTFVFPKKAPVWNVRTHEYLGVVDRVTTAAPISSASVFAQLPFRPTKIEVGVFETVVRGTDATFRFSLDVPESAAKAHFVFNVKLTKPDGSSSFLFERNLDAPGGQADFRFRIAANDPSGTWKVTVTEPLTGLSTVRTFTVR